ncbi:ABC transporter permease [Burkholderia multivorans]|uniref:ABC transporter permease n=1 Tax=Burkholderia multivorans TaxID=87883 RepID=UPI000D00C9B2|nr:ABC transporter permease [Burkholderia multivorans]MBU9398480.1 ABC transporter permease [Burkholderia multivorans]MDN8050872.1 ABC transporter permease [Burkholderia multivorans]MDR9238232.1 Teichoic acid translocation permease protein TagG [Burkholderia multivorans]MDR9268979.1 Teichoic acid translocation permease protein TagG [Burkholderia multivorans]MDR9285817.1 Teichoic acid translocation permease protein TagG [Burkholderia multivorans]
MLAMLKALWAYRGFIVGSVKREFQSKYRNSLLGAAWTVLNPLAMIVVYTVIFSRVMHARLPGVDNSFAYSIHLCAGVLPWGMFVEVVSRAQNTFIENANLIKKLSFPRLCLPVIVVANSLVNFAIVFTLFVVFLIVTGNFPGVPFLAVIPLLALLTLFAIGLGITLGVLNVFFRDVGQFFNIMLNFWFWLTPIVYSVDILPKSIQYGMQFNPMASLVQAFQTVMMQGKWPEWSQLWLVTALGIGLCLLGFSLFRKHAGEMVDEL